MFRWWSKCISSAISRTASRNVLFSSARISKALNVDRVRPPNDDSQDVTQFGYVLLVMIFRPSLTSLI